MTHYSCKVLFVYVLSLLATSVYSESVAKYGGCHESQQDCAHMRYWSHLEVLNATLSTQKFGTGKIQLSFESMNPGSSYTAAFENFIVRNRLLKAKFDSGPSVPRTDLLRIISSSQATCEEFCTRSQAIPDDQLLKVGEMLVIPKFASNNYLRKTQSDSVANVARDSPYFTEWPTLRHVHADRPTRAFQCPANMHMLAWHYGVAESGSVVDEHKSAAADDLLTVRAFPLETSSAYFQSNFFHEGSRQSNDTFTGYFTRFMRTGFPAAAPSDRLHAEDGEGEPISSPLTHQNDADELPAFAETSLRTSSGPDAGEYVFIPNTHVASFQCSKGAAAAAAACPLMAVCFVDASNLNLFRNALHFHGAVAATEEALHRAFTSPSFDADMSRSPADLPLAAYLSAAAAAVAGAAEASTTASATNVAASNGNRRDRRKKTGGADFKDWQELSRWRMLVTSLTIQKPGVPSVVAVGRQQVTLSWHSPFVPMASDKTVFGFKVVYCPVEAGQPEWREEIALPFGREDPRATACGSQKFLRMAPGDDGNIVGAQRISSSDESSSLLQEELDVAHLRRTGQEMLLFRAAVAGLLPDTQYQLRLSVLYDQKEGPLSAYTAAVRTAPVSAPSAPLGFLTRSATPEKDVQPFAAHTIKFSTAVQGYKTGTRVTGKLSFGWPEDDGGLPITGFHVYWRPASPSSSEQQLWQVADLPWQWLGAYPGERSADKKSGQIILLNLPSFKGCQFSIASFNAIGSSPKSQPSDIFAAAEAIHQHQHQHQHVVHGWGHEHYVGGLTQKYLREHSAVHGGAESSSEHGTAARLMVDHALSSACAATDENKMVFIDGDRQLIYSIANHCDHVGTEEDAIQGPKFEVWRAHWTPRHLSVFAEFAVVDSLVDNVVYGGHMRGKIVFCPRGDIPFTEKAVRAQRAGAAALIVVDGGGCAKYDQRCLPGASKAHNEGFGALDIKAHWDRVHIPVYFILQTTAQKVSSFLIVPFSSVSLTPHSDREL